MNRNRETGSVRTLIFFTLLALGAMLLFLQQEGIDPADIAPVAGTTTSTYVIENVAVRDLDGRVAWQGSVDLRPTLERIERGRADSHRGDGGMFENRERRLPDRPAGYYRKYVIRTPGIRHAGPQRLIVGRNGDLWYTPDHYRTFIQVAEPD